jgi:gliding motility-associated-like protein
MKGKITILKKYFFVVLMLTLSAKGVYGQTISVKSVNFTAACANSLGTSMFNSFTINFQLTGTFPAGDNYEVLISDDGGSFADPTKVRLAIAPFDSNIPQQPGETVTTNGQLISDFTLTPIEKKIRFGLPSTPPLKGSNNYRFRVRSIKNNAVFDNSTFYSAAYFNYNATGFSINGVNDVGNAVICGTGNSIKLSITPNYPGYDLSPLGLGLKFKWSKDGILIPGETGESITVTQAGKYFANVDYGGCSSGTDNFKSKEVNVTIDATSSIKFTILPSGTQSICGGSSVTLSTAAGYVSYEWFRDGNAIPNSNSFQYIATLPGIYSVNISAGACSGQATNTVQVTEGGFSASLNGPSVYLIQEGETKTISVNTNANNAIFDWYNGTTLLQSGPSNSFEVTAAGDYKVIVTGDSGTACIGSTVELPFKVKIGLPITQVPNVISPNNDGTNDTWMLPNEFLNSSDVEVKIISSKGDLVYQSNNYQNDWPQNEIDFKSINPIYFYVISKNGEEVKKGSLTVVK